jgi:hypothetical protein
MAESITIFVSYFAREISFSCFSSFSHFTFVKIFDSHNVYGICRRCETSWFIALSWRHWRAKARNVSLWLTTPFPQIFSIYLLIFNRHLDAFFVSIYSDWFFRCGYFHITFTHPTLSFSKLKWKLELNIYRDMFSEKISTMKFRGFKPQISSR